MPDDVENSERQRRRRTILILVTLLLSTGCIAFIICAYVFQLPWTGFNASLGPNVRQYQSARTLWDWLQLLIVPAVLLIFAYWFNRVNSRTEWRITAQRDETEHSIALDDQRARLLQDYLDRMSDLLLEQKFRDPQTYHDAHNIARARTLIVLPRLNDERKGWLLQFLYESQLINANAETCILLQGADLTKADLRGFDLSGANLSGVNLSGAKLSEANLGESQLQGACLNDADLSGAILRNANLSKADLREAVLNGAVLQEANLTQANLSRALLFRTDLTDAKLSDAIVNETKIEQAIHGSATFSSIQLSKMNGEKS